MPKPNKPVKERRISLKQAKREALEVYRAAWEKGNHLDSLDIADKLRIDLRQAVKAVDQLFEEGRIATLKRSVW